MYDKCNKKWGRGGFNKRDRRSEGDICHNFLRPIYQQSSLPEHYLIRQTFQLLSSFQHCQYLYIAHDDMKQTYTLHTICTCNQNIDLVICFELYRFPQNVYTFFLEIRGMMKLFLAVTTCSDNSLGTVPLPETRAHILHFPPPVDDLINVYLHRPPETMIFTAEHKRWVNFIL